MYTIQNALAGTRYEGMVIYFVTDCDNIHQLQHRYKNSRGRGGRSCLRHWPWCSLTAHSSIAYRF